MKTQNFSDFSIPASLKQALVKMDFIKATPVQSQVIPQALQGKDVLATAQTGTGKTGAFAIPLITQLEAHTNEMALILAPTRELAAQINTVLRQMTRNRPIKGTLVVGGESFLKQVREFERKPSYMVATPGRLNDHLEQGTIHLGRVKYLVLDEVDRMLDMGFAPQIRAIQNRLKSLRQTLLFSATLPSQTEKLAQAMMNKPVRVAVAHPKQEKPLVTERQERVSNDDKYELLQTLLAQCPGKVLIFARTQSRTDRLAKNLYKDGARVASLHGGKTQGQRKRSLAEFTSNRCPIMVATDIAGRGIDVDDIDFVINFDIPQNREDYVHRIGRTGRNGKTGTAITFIAPEDRAKENSVFGRKSEPRQGKKKKVSTSPWGHKKKKKSSSSPWGHKKKSSGGGRNRHRKSGSKAPGRERARG